MWFNLLYLTLLTAASPWVVYRAVRHGRYRRGTAQKLWGLGASRARAMTDGRPCRWIHAVSVGEVNLLPSVVERLEAAEPEVPVVISTSTDTGYDLAVERLGADRVFFCPLDFTWAVRRTLKSLGCTQLILAELELWPNLIAAAASRGVGVDVINARLSTRSASRYRRARLLLRRTFARLTGVACQDSVTADGFVACGTPKERVVRTGSLKFDNAPDSRKSPDVDRLSHWAGVDPWHRVWLVGSSGPGEEAMAISVFQSLVHDHPELRLILVPRHRERFEGVAAEIESRGSVVRRRSDATGGPGASPVAGRFSDRPRNWTSDEIILVDTIGELRSWWGVASIATVGGSFGDRGGQNMLEPAGYGCAVSFGPDTRNFRVIADQLVSAGGAVRVADQAELKAFVERCLVDVPAADALGRAAKQVVTEHRGALDRSIELLTRAA